LTKTKQTIPIIFVTGLTAIFILFGLALWTWSYFIYWGLHALGVSRTNIHLGR